MDLEFSLNLQDLEQILTKSHCSCHFINPNKTRIILWKETKDGVVTYYLRIGIQKFVSYPLTDKNGEVYWRFKPGEGKFEVEAKVTNDPDPRTKFQERPTKTEVITNHGKATNPEPVNSAQ